MIESCLIESILSNLPVHKDGSGQDNYIKHFIYTGKTEIEHDGDTLYEH